MHMVTSKSQTGLPRQPRCADRAMLSPRRGLYSALRLLDKQQAALLYRNLAARHRTPCQTAPGGTLGAAARLERAAEGFDSPVLHLSPRP